MVIPGDVVDFEITPPLVVLFLVVDVPLVAVDRGGRVRLRQASIGCLQMKGKKVVVVLLETNSLFAIQVTSSSWQFKKVFLLSARKVFVQ